MNGVHIDTHGRRTLGRRRCAWLCALAVLVFVTAGSVSPELGLRVAAAQEFETTSVREQGLLKIRRVEVEGNRTIPVDAIARKIMIRPDQEVTSQQIRAEVQSLHKTRWFFDVKPNLREADDGDGYVLVFKVRERPILQDVVYKGNEEIKTKQLAAITNLRKGSAFDVSLNRDSVRAIESYYQEKGFIHCKVTLEKGDHEDDREVVFVIDEGPKVVVTKIKFEGNDFFSGPLLRTKVVTKTRKLGFFGGKFDPASIPDDIVALKEYYFSLGFFDVKIENDVKQSKDGSKVQLTYTIDEGIRYKVGEIRFNGPRVIAEETFREQLKLREGDEFDERKLNTDIAMIKAAYGKLGRIFAVVNTGSKYYDEPGKMDLVFDVNEDQPYRINKIIVKFKGEYPTTKESTVLDRIPIKPGDLADPAVLKLAKSRLEGSQLFAGRGQPGAPPSLEVKQIDNEQVENAAREVVRAQYTDAPAQNPIVSNSPQGDPFGDSLGLPQADWVDSRMLDLEVGVEEAQTGRLMIGAGVNSDSGLVGSVVLDERNFDIFRPPTSWDDIWSGRAWRGAGQQFRLEAVPGTVVNRYLANWRDPYAFTLFDRDVSFGVSGFFFNRIYNDWDEQRLGGRVTLGMQLDREWSIGTAFRLEDVEISNPDVPTPPSLAEAVGNNFLSTVRTSVSHDTRDAAFLPSEGHFVEAAYEQAFGDYSYPKFELEGSQYFQVGSRADGSGRQIVTLRGQFGYTGEDTPIFEKFYAGGYQSFRGFRFRGVSPREFDVTVGGEFLTLGTVEYMVPLMANDSVQAVVFSDFGTVEENVTFRHFRASVGAGLRITVPALGPVPLALDWAVPVADQPYDDRQLFAFYFGVFN
ncbi:Outer membrane protein assembly factor BamA precursor [Symmachiella macrocystis]|uniref:Outer membrane protein assembly factor BamA n=1 Tax=Symmachiella macrocystis TaxID=2527985 RepID=A0A5C6BCH4_9PLAN|nr:Outer membrane protein assembly factor BamA precursor [Symmachiella macrocystis]